MQWILTTFWPRLARAFTRFNEDDDGLWAAGLAYYAVFSIFPLLLILTAILGMALRFSAAGQDAQEQIVVLVAESVSPSLAESVSVALSQVQRNAGVSGPLGIVTLLAGAIGIFIQFERAFDRIFRIRARPSSGLWSMIRGVLAYRLKAFLVLLAVGLLVVIVFLIGLAIAGMRQFTATVPGAQAAWYVVELVLILLLYWLLFTAIYKFFPKRKVPWIAAMEGGMVAAVLWEASRLALAALMISRPASAYGLIGAFMALVGWIYLAANVLFFGAEYVVAASEEPPAQEPPAQPTAA